MAAREKGGAKRVVQSWVQQFARPFDAMQYGVHLVVIPLCSNGQAGMNMGKALSRGADSQHPLQTGIQFAFRATALNTAGNSLNENFSLLSV
ncbi:hypothetical protein [Paraburkholderia bannensis]|uniref:hypothetical protein n=1 Tax=Paraburkholderia bannensis TaxID=765414 RepID=UPI002ABDDAE6|nr:hypothetical protein [Paraburkholderia bannensis]